MRSLLQRGIRYRHDSKDDNRFICNLANEAIMLLYKLQMLLDMQTIKVRTYRSTNYKYSEGGRGVGGGGE